MTITRRLISPYDGKTECKSVAEYLQHSQWAREKQYNENPGGSKQTAEATPAPTSFNAMMKNLEADKQGRIAAQIDQYRASAPAREEAVRQAAANPAAHIATNFAESGILSARSIRKLAEKGAAQAAHLDRQAAAEAVRLAFTTSEDYQIALRNAEATVKAMPTDALKTRALENLGYLKNSKTPEALATYWQTERGIVVDQVAALDAAAVARMSQRDSAVREYEQAASAAQAACASLAEVVEQTGGAE